MKQNCFAQAQRMATWLRLHQQRKQISSKRLLPTTPAQMILSIGWAFKTLPFLDNGFGTTLQQKSAQPPTQTGSLPNLIILTRNTVVFFAMGGSGAITTVI